MEKLKKLSKVMSIVFAFVMLFAVVQFVMNLVCLWTNPVAILTEEPGTDIVKVSGVNLGNYEMDFWKEQSLSRENLMKATVMGFLAVVFEFSGNAFLIGTIIKFLKPMTHGQPYDGTISKTMKKLGIGCIIICIVGNVIRALQVKSIHASLFEIANNCLSDEVSRVASRYNIQTGYLLIGILIFAFSMVFRYGEELQIQADETL